MGALRDPLMFQEKLLDAMEELIDDYEAYAPRWAAALF